MSKRILVVDDEARIREVLDYALRKEGYDVVAATDGREAIETAYALKQLVQAGVRVFFYLENREHLSNLGRARTN